MVKPKRWKKKRRRKNNGESEKSGE